MTREALIGISVALAIVAAAAAIVWFEQRRDKRRQVAARSQWAYREIVRMPDPPGHHSNVTRLSRRG